LAGDEAQDQVRAGCVIDIGREDDGGPALHPGDAREVGYDDITWG
jgi:hypothetical protein